MANNSDLNTVQIKSAFDARLQYFDNMKKYMDTLADAVFADNLMLQYRCLKGLFSLTAPYVKDDPNKKVRTLFKTISSNLAKSNKTSRHAATVQLTKLAELIYFNAKHLMLPQKLDDNEEIDWDKF